MIRTNLRNVRTFAQNRDEFNCNGTLTGEWIDGSHVKFGWIDESISLANHLSNSCKNFVIYSYDTPIAVYNHKGWWKNEDKYTRTTSRHQGAIGI